MEQYASQETTPAPVCACCEIEIDGTPYIRDGKSYCCEGCANGGPCTCDYVVTAVAVNDNESEDSTGLLIGDVLKNCLVLLDTWQQQPQKARQARTGDVLAQASAVLRDAARGLSGTAPVQEARPQISKPEPAPATLSIAGLTPGIRLQGLISRLRQLTPGRPFSHETMADGTTVFHLESGSLEPICEAISSIADYQVTSMSVSGDRGSISLVEAEREAAPAPAAVATVPRPHAPYELGVDVFFNARHHVANDERGGIHPHSWRIQARLTGNPDDRQRGLIGFSEVKNIIEQRLAPYHDKVLNQAAPFDSLTPSTENIAATLYDWVAEDLKAPGLALDSLCVWDSPTSYVVYRGKP